MTTFEPGAVVLVRFPFTDLTGSKKRPALVVSSLEHQKTGRDVIVAAITGQGIEDPRAFDHIVQDWASCGLIAPSKVRCGKLVTLERSMVRRTLGRMPPQGFRAVMGKVRQALAA
jgi:mRNA interferase MazF